MASGTETIEIEGARREIARGDAVAVDVRSEEEWGKAHVPGATHLPGADLDTFEDPPERGARLIVIAEDENSAAKAASRLSDQGYDAVAADGGMDAWISQDFNVQPTDDPDEDTELGAG
jgi:thiosulfate sulfurtransferase